MLKSKGDMTNFQVLIYNGLILNGHINTPRLLDVHWMLELKFMLAGWMLSIMMYTRCWVVLDVKINRKKKKVRLPLVQTPTLIKHTVIYKKV